MKLSTNFSLHEFVRSETAARKGIDNTPSEEIQQNLMLLCEELLQPLRDAMDRTVRVSSGYRSPALNKAIGGSKNSSHMSGLAADFDVDGMTPLEVCRAIVDLGLPFDQVIHEFGEWTHASVAARGAKPRGQLLTIDRKGTRVGLHEIRR